MSKARGFLLALLAMLAVSLPAHRDASARVQPSPLPVSPADPSMGSAAAPVTLVIFTDLECPYCAKLHATVQGLKTSYGKQLRVVFKHFPLQVHKGAYGKAEAAQAIWSLYGERRFSAFLDAAFADPRGDWRHYAKDAGASVAKIQRALDSGAPRKKVDADLDLVRKVGVRGTPASFVNGVLIGGARSEQTFESEIDAQIAAAAKLRRRGVPAPQISDRLTRQNFQKPALKPSKPKPSPSKPKPSRPSPSGGGKAAAETVWKVPVGTSPQLGPSTALVTLVVFSDFQCPYCRRLEPVLKKLRKKYGGGLRLVFKNNPLPFHKRAEPAAQLAMEAFTKLGHAGFWRAHDLLFQNQKALEEADFARYARKLGLRPSSTLAAVRRQKHKKRIGADRRLAADLEARGTPHSFVNGRRVPGAQPSEAFEKIIDEELAKAKKLRAQGVPARSLYARIIKDGKSAPPPEKKTVPAPNANNPRLGPANAKVTIQMFTDFECSFCGRVRPTLEKIRAHYGRKVSLVFRHYPLRGHRKAPMLHNAAAEAFRQGGHRAFWKMHDALFAQQRNIDRTQVEALARSQGLDMQAFRNALDNASHQARIDADVKIAKDAGMTGTPAFVINGYFVSGAQPFSKFERVIDLALSGK